MRLGRRAGDMEMGRSLKQTTSLDVRLNDETQRLRKEAQGTTPASSATN
jgi:hypothetical protein